MLVQLASRVLSSFRESVRQFYYTVGAFVSVYMVLYNSLGQFLTEINRCLDKFWSVRLLLGYCLRKILIAMLVDLDQQLNLLLSVCLQSGYFLNRSATDTWVRPVFLWLGH